MGRFRAFVCCWLAAYVAAYAMQSGPTLRTIDKGGQSAIDGRREVVVRTSPDWTALWKQHTSDKPVPPVDFEREMVVAVFMGSRPTAGYSVEVTSAEARNGTVVVTYRELAPSRDAVTAQILTSPYHIVAVATKGGEVSFRKIPD
jgi:protease stability complex PrcB-like protein